VDSISLKSPDSVRSVEASLRSSRAGGDDVFYSTVSKRSSLGSQVAAMVRADSVSSLSSMESLSLPKRRSMVKSIDRIEDWAKLEEVEDTDLEQTATTVAGTSIEL